MKEALKNDRARIQVGRISSFGLMEMSRQRLRTGVLEASTKACPHCEGTGLMRTAASAGLSALRMIEDEAARGRGEKICLRAGKEAAVYVLNKKRAELADIEQRYGVSIDILIDESFEGARMTVESSGPRPVAAPRPQEPTAIEEDLEEIEDLLEGEEDEEEQVEARPERGEDHDGERQGRRRRRRRRGGRGRRREGEGEPSSEGEAAGVEAQSAEPSETAEAPVAEEEVGAPKRRRRRRGRGGARGEEATIAEAGVEPDSSPMVERPIDQETPIAETAPVEEPKPKRRRSKKAAAEPEADVAVTEPAPADTPPAETADQAAPPAKPTRKRKSKVAAAGEEEVAPAQEPTHAPAANNDTAEEEPAGEPRRGWWQKTFG
jgi:ribonuclease E